MRVDKSQRYENNIFVEVGGKTLYFRQEHAQSLRNVLEHAALNTSGTGTHVENAGFKVDRYSGSDTVVLASKTADGGRNEVSIDRNTSQEITRQLDDLATREAQIQKGYDRLKGK